MNKNSLTITSRMSSVDKEIPIIKIGGFLDAHTAIQLEKTLRDFFNNNYYKIVIDFSSLEHISSGGVGVFMGMIDEVRRHSGEILLINLRPIIARIFYVLGLNKFFRILYIEVEAAVKLFSSSNQEAD